MKPNNLYEIEKSLCIALVFFSSVLFPIMTYSQQLIKTADGKNSAFQKTDTSLLYEIKTNLRTYDNPGNYIAEEQIKPPRQRRFELAEKGLHKLIYKNSVPNTIFGSTLGAIATAHPTGLILGGISGLLQGKSHRYEEAQGKIHLMEREIFASKPYELTDEEIRLALYTGADLSEFSNHSQVANTDVSTIEDLTKIEKQEEAIENSPAPEEITPVQEIAVIVETIQPTAPDVDYCHDLAMGNTKPVDNATRRELVTFCYYHLN